jgi:hypothetical protein
LTESASVGPWDAGRLPYQDEATVELLAMRVGHRKVCTIDELQEVLRESERGLPAIRLWLHERLDEVVHRIREEYCRPTPKVTNEQD